MDPDAFKGTATEARTSSAMKLLINERVRVGVN